MISFMSFLWFFIRYTSFIPGWKLEYLLTASLGLPSAIAAYKSISSNAVAADFPVGFWFLFVQILTTVYNTGCIFLLIAYYLKLKTNKSRILALILCISGFTLVTLSWAADYMLGVNKIQNLMPFWLLIWIGILLYTIKRYRFITITPDFISYDIIENIEEGIILLDPDLKVIFTNRALRWIINANDDAISGLHEIVMEKKHLHNKLSELMESGLTSFKIRVNIIQRQSGNNILADMNVKKIIDSFRDTSGYLVIVSRLRDIKELQHMYGVTGRELDIIRQISSAKSNREIAELYKLTERTVETHISNIYNRLGINKRVELLNILSGFYPHDNQPGSASGKNK